MADTIVIETPVATVLEVSGKQGPQGVPGATGATGATGPQGPAGTGIETLTQKGDLLSRNDSAAIRVGIGSTGQVLKVASTGLPAWENESGGVPTSRTISAGTGLTGGGDLSANRTLAVSFGSTAGTACEGNDSRLSNARTPTAHAASHAIAGIKAAFSGQVDGMTSNVSFRAIKGGTIGNSIVFSFDGSNDIQSVFESWNDNNPNNQAEHLSGDLSQVPDSGETITLSGGAAGADLIFDQDVNTTDNVAFNKLTLNPDANDSSLKLGTLEFQGYALNNAWIGDNVYFDGANFKRRTSGAATLFYFQGEEGQFRCDTSNVAGTTVTSAPAFKVGAGGKFSAGANVSNSGSFEAGMLYSNGNNIGFSDKTDNSKKVTLDLSGITAGQTRLLALPNSSGTIALKSDIPANTISSTIVDAKGDLIVGTAADTVARLPVGATNGHVLTVDSAEASGMKWAAASGGVTSVTGTAPIVSSGGTTPAISISAATTSAAGSMSAADKTKLDAITGTNTGDQTITLTGDVTGSGTGSFAATIANNAVTNAKLAQVATSTIKGRATAATGNVEDLTATQVRTILNVADGATANSSDATLLNRANHTGTQAAGTITGLATVATTGAYSDLSGRPTLGTAAAAATTDFAAASHTHAASAITSGTLDNARVNFAAPAAIGGTTPNSITGTVIVANTELTIPSSSPASPSAGDIYRVTNDLRFRDSTNTERTVSVTGHTHSASDITSGLAASATTDTTNASNISSGTLEIARIPTGTTSTTVALGNHSHELTALAATGATNGHVLTANGSGGVTFAAASGGVSAVDSTTADVFSVSGSNLVADDGGLIDSANPFVQWNDTSNKLVYANPLSRPSGAFYVGLAPTTTALGTNAVNIQPARTAATNVAAHLEGVAIGNNTRTTGNYGVVVGNQGSFAATSGACFGPGCYAAANSVCVGNGAGNDGVDSVAIGDRAYSNTRSVSVGQLASYNNTTAEVVTLGYSTNSSATRGIVVGYAITNTLRGGFLTNAFGAAYWSGQTTTNAATILNLDGTATNRFTIAASTALAVDILLVARRATTQDKWLVARRFLGIRRDGSNNTALIGTVQTLGTDQSAGSPTWTFALTADDVNEALQLEVVGATGETVEWRATAFYRNA